MKALTLVSAGLVLSTLVASPVNASETPITKTAVSNNPQIDYPGFLKLTSELSEYRTTRLVTLDDFQRLASSEGALILDTRSAAAFARGHIEGAINLPFSDFTDEKLAQYLGDKERPILIYCNNNFRDDLYPVVRKSAPLALNIPTFINLFGYGYKNIYELNDVVAMSDPRVDWTRLEAGAKY